VSEVYLELINTHLGTPRKGNANTVTVTHIKKKKKEITGI
jgi:hypothetical protein